MRSSSTAGWTSAPRRSPRQERRGIPTSPARRPGRHRGGERLGLPERLARGDRRDPGPRPSADPGGRIRAVRPRRAGTTSSSRPLTRRCAPATSSGSPSRAPRPSTASLPPPTPRPPPRSDSTTPAASCERSRWARAHRPPLRRLPARPRPPRSHDRATGTAAGPRRAPRPHRAACAPDGRGGTARGDPRSAGGRTRQRPHRPPSDRLRAGSGRARRHHELRAGDRGDDRRHPAPGAQAGHLVPPRPARAMARRGERTADLLDHALERIRQSLAPSPGRWS